MLTDLMRERYGAPVAVLHAVAPYMLVNCDIHRAGAKDGQRWVLRAFRGDEAALAGAEFVKETDAQ